jgi:hypothetical protein
MEYSYVAFRLILGELWAVAVKTSIPMIQVVVPIFSKAYEVTMFLLHFLSYKGINYSKYSKLVRYDFVYVDSHGALSTWHRYGTFRYSDDVMSTETISESISVVGCLLRQQECIYYAIQQTIGWSKDTKNHYNSIY